MPGALEDHWARLGALPYWGHAWPGGQALARYLIDHPDLIRGREVLDVAAGSGLVAIAAALAGAAKVTAADVDASALAAVERNAAVNGVRIEVERADLLDGPVLDGPVLDDPALDDPGAAWDVVLAADACYEAVLARRLQMFARRAAAAGSLVLLGDPGRPYLELSGLRRLATYDVPTPEGVEQNAITPTGVWLVRPSTTAQAAGEDRVQPRS